jgi:hypothetical protein
VGLLGAVSAIHGLATADSGTGCRLIIESLASDGRSRHDWSADCPIRAPAVD